MERALGDDGNTDGDQNGPSSDLLGRPASAQNLPKSGPSESGPGRGQAGEKPSQFDRSLGITDIFIAVFTVVSGLAAVASAGVAIWTAGQLGTTTAQTDAAIRRLADLGVQTKRQADATTQQLSFLKEQVGEAKAQTKAIARQTTGITAEATATEGQLKEFHEAQRPRIFIVNAEVDGQLTFDGKQAGITITYTIRNSGNSDAAYVYPFGIFIIRPESFLQTLAKQSAFCDFVRKNRDNATWKHYGEVVARDETISINGVYVMSEADFAVWKTLTKDNVLRIGVPAVTGCIDYVFDGRHHQTTFTYEIDKHGGGINPFELINPADGNLPANQIILGRHPGLSGESD